MTTETIGTLDYNEITFPKLGIDLHLDSTAFSIGGLDIQWYGILITLGLVLAMVYAFTQVKKYGLTPDRVMDCIIGGIIGGVVGARAYYVLLNWNNYAGDWKSILNIREGGLAIYGGIIGSFLAGLLVAKIRKVKFLPLLDIVGIGFLLGQGIGRWGNFFNQEAFGCNTNSIFGMSGGRIQEWITDQYPSTTYFANFGTALDASQPVHPVSCTNPSGACWALYCWRFSPRKFAAMTDRSSSSISAGTAQNVPWWKVSAQTAW